jgi:nucleoside-diphosphate-sugar epimerase
MSSSSDGLHVLVTGADGFIGRALVQRLLQDAAVLGSPIARLTLLDRNIHRPDAARSCAVPLHIIEGDLSAAAILDRALAEPVQCVFHLASMPGSAAEQNPAQALRTNLEASLNLAHGLAAQAEAGGPVARLVFASSIAVYGALPPAGIDEAATPAPQLGYGAHKWMTEILLADLSRRQVLDARSLRLPGIVARPLQESGHGSAFMSQLLRHLAAGQDYVCPVSPLALAWWMSAQCCVDNLLHASRLPVAGLPFARTWQLPVLHASVADVIAALVRRYGRDRAQRVRHVPNPMIESLFGRLPPLRTPQAEAAGFHHDGELDALIRHALD